jgi:hypothetical protein
MIFYADSVTDDDDESQAGENDEPKTRGQQADPVGHDKKDEWDLAVRFRDIQRYGYLQPKERKEMSEKAIQAVMDRAHESLGPVQKPYHYELLSESELAAFPHAIQSVDLDIEETLNQNLISRLRDLPTGVIAVDPVYQVRIEKDHGLILALDTSLSMKGEKLALLGVTVAAVAMSLPSNAFAILGFDSEIHTIKKFSDSASIEECVERVLSIPPGGFTNIELGLKAAQGWIQESHFPQTRVILISDGRYTEGKDPVLMARQFPFVYPIKIGKDPTGRSVMKDIAQNALEYDSSLGEIGVCESSTD